MGGTSKRVIACIFARGGSKGLPKKNIHPFAGKPLIAWAIEHAKYVSRIDRVIVSTDSDEIASVAEAYGAEVPFMRPAELATDTVSEWPSWQHALSYIQQDEGRLPWAMVAVPTTAPLRIPEDIEACLDLFEQGDTDAVITITDAHRNPYFNMVRTNLDGTVEPVLRMQDSVHRRQGAPLVFDIVTVAYVVRPAFVLSSSHVFEGRIKAVRVPLERAVDIDTRMDLDIAEYLFQRQRSR